MNPYSRASFGAVPTLTTAAITPIPVEFWLAEPQNIRKYMGSTKQSAIAYIKSNLTTMLSIFKTLLSAGESKFTFGQAQYVADQLVKIHAMDKVMQDSYQFNMAEDADILALVTQIHSVQTQLEQFNPDIGQLTYLTDLLAYRSSRGEAVGPLQFVPQFTTDKTPILITPSAGVPGSNLTPGTAGARTGSNTMLYVGIAAVAAYFAFKG
jgi:hypothetical protein